MRVAKVGDGIVLHTQRVLIQLFASAAHLLQILSETDTRRRSTRGPHVAAAAADDDGPGSSNFVK